MRGKARKRKAELSADSRGPAAEAEGERDERVAERAGGACRRPLRVRQPRRLCKGRGTWRLLGSLRRTVRELLKVALDLAPERLRAEELDLERARGVVQKRIGDLRSKKVFPPARSVSGPKLFHWVPRIGVAWWRRVTVIHRGARHRHSSADEA